MLFSLAAAAASAWVQGETYDEPDHIAYARRLVETGETERLSVLHYNSKTPGTVPNALARQAAKSWLGVRGPERLRFFSRLPTVGALALLLGTVFVVGRRFLGEAAACLATTACALDPNLIANSSVATVDTVYALATLLTLGAVLWMVERPSIGRAALVGAALGLAFVAKFSAFLLVPAVLVFPWLIHGMRARLRTWTLVPGALAAVAAMLLVIGAAYRFRNVGVEVNDLGWRSPLMLRVHSLVPHLRLPVPADFMSGFDLLAVAVDKDYPVVLLGRHHPRGVWYYFLVVWLLKEPVLLLAAQVFGIVRTVATGALWTQPALAYLALTLAAKLVYFSFFFATQVGFRFVLMCLPLVALIAAAGLAPLAATAARETVGHRSRGGRAGRERCLSRQSPRVHERAGLAQARGLPPRQQRQRGLGTERREDPRLARSERARCRRLQSGPCRTRRQRVRPERPRRRREVRAAPLAARARLSPRAPGPHVSLVPHRSRDVRADAGGGSPPPALHRRCAPVRGRGPRRATCATARRWCCPTSAGPRAGSSA